MGVRGITAIAVVGAGTMGRQVALCAAIAGYKVKCTDVAPDALARADEFVDTYLPGRVAKGKMTGEVARQARTNICFLPSLEEAASEVDFVIEAVPEKLELKRDLFSRLHASCPPRAILATNASCIGSSELADATGRPDRVVNMHFFNPALVMKLVEVMKGPQTSDETAAIAMAVSESMGKIPVLLKKEIRGGICSRFHQAITAEAFYLYDMGIASHEDIDTAVVNGLGHPMGPFRLLDLTGIDALYVQSIEHYQETGDPSERPSPTLVEKYVKNEWGRKTGKGFYDYGGQG